MDCRGRLPAQALAKNLDLRSHRRLLDIASGSGIYACSLAAHFPELNAAVLEKPPVDRIAFASWMLEAGFDRPHGVPSAVNRSALVARKR